MTDRHRLRYLPKKPRPDGPAPDISFDVAMRFWPALARYARKLMGSGPGRPGRRWSLGTDPAGDAEDLLQETYARALLRWQRPGARPRAESDVQAWLHRIMLRLWLGGERKTHARAGKLVRARSEIVQATHGRASAGAGTSDRSVRDADAGTPCGHLADKTVWCHDPREAIVTRLDVDRALAELTPRQRKLMKAVAAGADRKVIAEREGVKRVTVDARVLRARGVMSAAMQLPSP